MFSRVHRSATVASSLLTNPVNLPAERQGAPSLHQSIGMELCDSSMQQANVHKGMSAAGD